MTVSNDHLKTPGGLRISANLPELLSEIAEITDEQAAMLVARAKGGTRTYIPKHPGATHWLTLAVGAERARIIGRHFSAGNSGISLEIPLGPMATNQQRWRRVKQLKAEGHSKHEIARMTGFHYKTVQRLTNGKRMTYERVTAQSDLFDPV